MYTDYRHIGIYWQLTILVTMVNLLINHTPKGIVAILQSTRTCLYTHIIELGQQLEAIIDIITRSKSWLGVVYEWNYGIKWVNVWEISNSHDILCSCSSNWQVTIFQQKLTDINYQVTFKHCIILFCLLQLRLPKQFNLSKSYVPLNKPKHCLFVTFFFFHKRTITTIGFWSK